MKGFLDPSLGSQDYVMEEGSCPEHQEEERGGITSAATCLPTAVAESLSTVTLPRFLVPAARLPDHFLWCLLLQKPNGPLLPEHLFVFAPCSVEQGQQQQHFLVQLLSNTHRKYFH